MKRKFFYSIKIRKYIFGLLDMKEACKPAWQYHKCAPGDCFIIAGFALLKDYQATRKDDIARSFGTTRMKKASETLCLSIVY